ncbi:MAG: PilZ domain-containing protein [Nitrospirota bacterium]
MQERRQHRRYKMNGGIHGKIPFADDVKIIDMSIGGVALKVDRRLNVGKEYQVKLLNRSSSVSLRGKVIWCVLSESRKDAGGNVIPIYTAGLQFNEVSDEKREEIAQFMEEHAKREIPLKSVSFQNDFINLSDQFKEALEIFTDA